MSGIRVAALLLALCVLRPLAAGDRMIAGSRHFFTAIDGESAVDLFRAGNFTADGHADVLIVADDTATVYPGTGTGLFGEPVTTSIAGYTILGAADLNKDGRPDLVLTDTEYNYLLGIMLSNANGTFGTIATTVTNSEIAGAVAGDFDGDTHPDLALSVRPNRILGFFGNGDGTFAAPTESAPFVEYEKLVTGGAGDVDGDGDLDAVFAGREGTVRVFLSSASRGFTEGPSLDRSGDFMPVAVADFDGDGKADVATGRSSYPNDFAEIAFSSGSTFAAVQELPVRDAYDAAAADLDGNGIPELILSSGTSVAVLKRNGPASLDRPRLFHVGRRAHRIAVADFDGDAKLDVVTAQHGWTFPAVSFSLTRGNGDGTFAAAPSIDIQTDVRDTWRDDHDLGIADVNGDSRADLITATNSWHVSPNGHGFGLAVFLARAEGGYAAPVFTVPAHNIYEQHSSAFAGDLNGDGKPEVIVNSATGFNGDPVRWTVLSVSANGTMITLATWNDTVGLLRLVDATGDGRIDVIDDAGYIHPGTGTASLFEPKLAHPVDLSNGMPFFVDLNADGRLDRLAVWGNYLRARLQNADGTFTPIIESWGYGISAVGDMNGDGFADVVSSIVQFGNGNGTFGEPVYSMKSARTNAIDEPPPGASYQNLALSAHNTFDFDGDGHLDAFAGRSVYFGDGAGHFTDVVTVSGDQGWSFLHDVDQDGRPEIVFREAWGATSFHKVGAPRGTIPATLTITPSVNPSEYGQRVTLTAKVAASNLIPNGPLWVTVGTITYRETLVNGSVTFERGMPVGSTNVTASFHGDEHLAPGTASFTQTVTQAPTTTTIRALYPTRPFGQPVHLGATLSTAHLASTYASTIVLKKGGVSLGTIPTGTYRLFTDPALFPIGTHTLTAEFPGSVEFGPSVSQPFTITITKALTNFTVSTPTSPLVSGQQARLVATFTQHPGVTGSVLFAIGTTVIGSAPISSGIAQLDAPLNVPGGMSRTITATYSGDATYAGTKSTALVTIYQGGFEARPLLSATLSFPFPGGWSVALSPAPLVGATSYDLYRSTGGAPFTFWRSVPAAGPWPVTEQTTAPELVRLYKVIARGSGGSSSQPSPVAIALGMQFQDATLNAGTTAVKAIHFTEAQVAVNAIRAAVGLPAAGFRTIAPGVTVQLDDIISLRQALADARAGLGLATSFTDHLLPGTLIHARHLQEVRDAMR